MRRTFIAPALVLCASALFPALAAGSGQLVNNPPAPTVIVVTPMLPGLIATSQGVKPSVTPLSACRPKKFYEAADVDMETEILRRINSERSARSLKPYALAPALVQSARRHALDMAAHDFFDHVGWDKSDYRARIDGACYPWSRISENIGAGYGGDPEKVMKSWMASPPHRAAILSREFTEAGVGYATNDKSALKHYWTVNFGTPRDGAALKPATATAAARASATPRP